MFVDSINRRSKIPFYQQLYEILRGKIVNGEWKPGDMMPPESELIEQYQVSRNTVRQVLDLLVQEGLIYRQRGRGTFVSHPTLEQTMLRIISFTEDMEQRGFVPSTEVLSAQIVTEPSDIAGKLHMDEGEELAVIERLRLADGEPMSVEKSFLIHRYCPNILRYDYARNPLRQVLERDYRIRLVHARQVIRAVMASDELAEILDIKMPSPLLFIERVTYSQDMFPVEYLEIFYRADRYSLYNELQD
jgi:GntR family transcriptional regulator